MSASIFRFLLLSLVWAAGLAQAGTPIPEMTCADYLGIEREATESSASSGEKATKSAAYKTGFKLGVAMRQSNIANWLQGYLAGYAAATRNKPVSAPVIDHVKSKLQAYCATHHDQSIRQVAEAFSVP